MKQGLRAIKFILHHWWISVILRIRSWSLNTKNTKEGLYSELTLWKMILVRTQYSLNRDHQHYKWQQQKSWIPYPDFQEVQVKHLMQYPLYAGENGRCINVFETFQVTISRYLDTYQSTHGQKIMVQYGRSSLAGSAASSQDSRRSRVTMLLAPARRGLASHEVGNALLLDLSACRWLCSFSHAVGYVLFCPLFWGFTSTMHFFSTTNPRLHLVAHLDPQILLRSTQRLRFSAFCFISLQMDTYQHSRPSPSCHVPRAAPDHHIWRKIHQKMRCGRLERRTFSTWSVPSDYRKSGFFFKHFLLRENWHVQQCLPNQHKLVRMMGACGLILLIRSLSAKSGESSILSSWTNAVRSPRHSFNFSADSTSRQSSPLVISVWSLPGSTKSH